jgi:hypothetical protein
MAVARGVSAVRVLTKAKRGLIAAPMIDAATILTARHRRRALAVWAVVCV